MKTNKICWLIALVAVFIALPIIAQVHHGQSSSMKGMGVGYQLNVRLGVPANTVTNQEAAQAIVGRLSREGFKQGGHDFELDVTSWTTHGTNYVIRVDLIQRATISRGGRPVGPNLPVITWYATSSIQVTSQRAFREDFARDLANLIDRFILENKNANK